MTLCHPHSRAFDLSRVDQPAELWRVEWPASEKTREATRSETFDDQGQAERFAAGLASEKKRVVPITEWRPRMTEEVYAARVAHEREVGLAYVAGLVADLWARWTFGMEVA